MSSITILKVFRRIVSQMSNKLKIEKIKENAEVAKKTIEELKQEVSCNIKWTCHQF